VPVVAKEVTPVDEAAESSEDVAPAQPFSPEERQLVQAIVGASERPLSFQQIHDLLRNTRNRGADGVSRTNEELRSLIKLSINSGELNRIGRGNRVSYRLAVVAPVSEPANVVAPVSEPANVVAPVSEPANVVAPVSEPANVVAPVSEPANVVAPVSEPANVVAPVTMIPTPADVVDDGLTLPTAPSKAPRRTKRQDAVPAVVVASPAPTPPSPAPEAKKPNQRRTPKATPATPAKAAELTPPVASATTPELTSATPRRRKKTTE
jgi:hypothetical protein